MNQLDFSFVINKNDLINCLQFIKDLDKFFNPPIAEKVDLRLYLEKLLTLGFILAVKDKAKYVGLAGFYCNDTATNVGYLSYFAIQEEYHGTGIARQLIGQVHSKMIEKNMKSSKVETTEMNEVANKFYLKNGYSLFNSYIDKYGVAKVVLTIELEPKKL